MLSPQCYKLHSAGLVYRAAAQTYYHFTGVGLISAGVGLISAGAGLISAAGRHSNVPKGLGR